MTATFHLLGSGIVGDRVARLLHRHAVVTHPPRRTEFPGVHPGDIVILTQAGDHAHAAASALEVGAHVVSVGDGPVDTRAQLALGALARTQGVTLVVGAALAPGLSCLIARHLSATLASVDEIHVAIHGTAGPECARAHHRGLQGPAIGWHDGSWVDYIGGSGRELCWFPEPIGARDCYRIGHSAPIVLQRAFPEVRRVSVRRSATRRDRLTSRLPMMRPPHPEGGVGALRVEVRGAAASGARESLIAGVAELVGTAAAATAVAFAEHLATGALPPGLVVPGAAGLPTLDLLRAVEAHGVRLQTFTGIPVSVAAGPRLNVPV